MGRVPHRDLECGPGVRRTRCGRRRTRRAACWAGLVLAGCLVACSRTGNGTDEADSAAELPAILLVTLDTTRADVMGWESEAIETPSLEALAARGVRFAQAYATAPLTLPSHTSMLTGLYPREHGIHENSRVFDRPAALLAGRLRERGYGTAAFVSSLPLARQFGLHAGFDLYDDDLGAANERKAGETTRRAIEHLRGMAGEAPSRPAFVWVHYFDPHDPYDPPEPFRSRHAASPYLGEVAYMDSELGRLIGAFEEHAGVAGRPWRVLVVGDHGEGLGEHGEAFHGNLLYQGVVRVPLVVAGSDMEPGRVVAAPVSGRRVFHTILAWAEIGDGAADVPSLLEPADETVFAEAMKPFLEYGWQAQVMAVRGNLKAIWSGQLELYDVAADALERRDLATEAAARLDAGLLAQLMDYPTPNAAGAAAGGERVDEATRARLAALGYTGGEAATTRRRDAPAPREMAHLFADLDRGSGLFLQHRYAEALPVLERLASADPGNVTVHLRLAVARSVLGLDAPALASFEQARSLAPDSLDVRYYLGVHQLRAGRLAEADALLTHVLEQTPERVATLEAMAQLRARQGRLEEARSLLEDAVSRSGSPSAPALILFGELSMGQGDTAAARDAFERARALQGEDFAHHLELGVLYLAEQRFAQARDALDQVPADHPGHAMALFKRAQVSVLLDEPDRERRVREAWRAADPDVRRLMQSERLFAGIALD